MVEFKVVEKFVSIDGEGPMSGGLAVFIRFEGCNLKCSWCDTRYAWDGADYEVMSVDEIIGYINESGVKRVTLTGGEPLIQEGIEVLLERLSQEEVLVHIETNGAVSIKSFKEQIVADNIRYIVDCKLPESGMADHMVLMNVKAVTEMDVYKFVIASEADLKEAADVIDAADLTSRCQVFLSPVVDRISPETVVNYMKQRKMNDVRLQLQLHKLIWPKEARGV